MFYNQSGTDGDDGAELTCSGRRMAFDAEDSGSIALSPEGIPDQREWNDREEGKPSRPDHHGYERELIQSVWEFAEKVAGNDPELWRKDEFGEWIYRLDYGRRSSEFGWEIFDPGIGRHAQGVYAMRPMQWQNYIRQYEAFA